MARKTLGKMEFETLINQLKEDNKGQLAAQQETTKSLRSLHAYFIKKDRRELREDLEKEMEGGEGAERVGIRQKLKGAVDDVKGALRGKGLAGVLSNFLTTGLLGTSGTLLFKSAISAIKFEKGFGMKLGRALGAAILVPSLWNALSEAFKQKDFKSGMDTFIGLFFGDGSAIAKPFGERIGDAAGKGALLGFTVGGVQGMILGGLIGAAIVALPKVFENDKIKPSEMYEKIKKYMSDNLFDTVAKGSAVAGAGIGALIGRGFGPTGMIAGAMLGAGIGFLGGVLTRAVEIQESEQTTLGLAFKKAMFEQIMNNKSLAAGLFGMGIGATIGAFSPVGMLGGAIIGAAIGAATGAIAEQLEEGGFGHAVRNAFRRLTLAWEEATSGNFDQARRILSGQVAVDLPQLERNFKKGDMTVGQYTSSKASMLGIDAKKVEKLNEAIDKLRDFKAIEPRQDPIYLQKTGKGFGENAWDELIKNYEKRMAKHRPGVDQTIYYRQMANAAAGDTQFSVLGKWLDDDTGEADALKWFLEGRDKEEDRLRNKVHKEANIVELLFPTNSKTAPPTSRTKLIDNTLINQWRKEILELLKLKMQESLTSSGTGSGVSVVNSMGGINSSHTYNHTEYGTDIFPFTSENRFATTLLHG